MTRRYTNEELMIKQEQFLRWANNFTHTLMELHQIGFKGYLIKNDGTIETIMHDWAQREIDMIHECIESKKIELGIS